MDADRLEACTPLEAFMRAGRVAVADAVDRLSPDERQRFYHDVDAGVFAKYAITLEVDLVTQRPLVRFELIRRDGQRQVVQQSAGQFVTAH